MSYPRGAGAVRISWPVGQLTGIMRQLGVVATGRISRGFATITLRGADSVLRAYIAGALMALIPGSSVYYLSTETRVSWRIS